MSQVKQKFIENNAVSNAKLAQMAQGTVKGNTALSTGNAEDITMTKLLAMMHAGAWIKDEDFGQGTVGTQGYASVVAGAGASVLGTFIAGVTGIISMATGTTATGSVVVHDIGTTTKHLAGAGELVCIVKFKLNVLSNATNRFSLRLGFGDTTTAAADNIDSAGYIEYSDNVNSGNWVYCTASNSTRTKVNSTVAPVAITGDNWMYLKIVCNSAGTQTDFYINNTLLGSITTNIPTTAGRTFDTKFSIAKSVGATVTPTLNIDRIYQHYIRSDANSANWRL